MRDATDFVVIVSEHAIRRAQQRGVTRNAVSWTALYGDCSRAVGGVMRRTMSRRSMERLAKNGVDTARREQTRGTVIITRDEPGYKRYVLTVRPTEKNGKRRGGRHKPKHGDGRRKLQHEKD